MGAGKIGLKYPPRSDDHRQNISLSKKGNKSSLGRVLSGATKEKLRQANLGKQHSVETRKKRATLTDEDVRKIRAMRLSGLSYRDISEAMGVKRQLVGRVCLRERYEWVDPDDGPILMRTKNCRKHSTETSKRHSEAGKARWAARKLAGVPNPRHKTPRNEDQRANIAAASRAAWRVRKQNGAISPPPRTPKQIENYRASALKAWARIKSV